MIRAAMGIDERSEEVKRATTVEANAQCDLLRMAEVRGIREAEVYVTTQLVSREKLSDGIIVEEYSTVAIARTPTTGSVSDQNTENSVTVYATVNYKCEIADNLNLSFDISNTSYRAVYPSSVSVTSMYLKNEIDNSYTTEATNSRTIGTVTMGTWYTLGAPTSRLYAQASANLYAFATAYLAGGAQAHVRCAVYCHNL